MIQNKHAFTVLAVHVFVQHIVKIAFGVFLYRGSSIANYNLANACTHGM